MSFKTIKGLKYSLGFGQFAQDDFLLSVCSNGCALQCKSFLIATIWGSFFFFSPTKKSQNQTNFAVMVLSGHVNCVL